MEKFTQLGLDRKSEVKPSPTISAPKPQPGKKPNGTKRTAAFVASSVAGSLLAVFLLQTSGCSKEGSKSPTVAPSNQAMLNQPATPASAPSTSEPTTTQAAAQPAAPKKIVKRRPSTLAYNDAANGVTFRYPRRYALKTPDNSKPETASSQAFDMNFVQPGGVSVASVELPKGSYPGTDLASASFNVSVNRAMTAEQCGQFSLLQLASSDEMQVQPAKVKLGGQELEEMEAISGPDGKQADAKYFHRFENGACYEFSLGLSTQSDGTEDGVMPVDREDVFHRLERILATVKIDAATPAAAETPAVTLVTATPVVPAVAAVPAAPTTPASPDVAVQQ
ncbi:MAG: hypothetical protein WB952_25470 [Terriglobales bacterium]